MNLQEENLSKLFQATFSCSSTPGTVLTRAQLPAQGPSRPCEKNHVGNLASEVEGAQCYLHPEEPRNNNSLFSPCRGDGPQDMLEQLFSLTPGSTMSCLSTCKGTSLGNTRLPPVHHWWEQPQFFRYTRLPRWESKQEHKLGADTQWHKWTVKDSKAQF